MDTGIRSPSATKLDRHPTRGASRTRLAYFTNTGIFTSAVNITSRVKIAGALEVETLRILRAIPGVTVDLAKAPGESADAVLYAGGLATPLVIEAKGRVNAATARLVVDRRLAGLRELRVLVVAAETTEDAREILRAAGMGIVDGDGNAHIELPGIVVHVEGRPDVTSRRVAPVRLSGKAGVVAQALLVGQDRAWKVTDLAEEAQVSVGLAHRVLERLEDEGVIRVEGAGPARTRFVDNHAALLDLWAEEQRDRPLRTKAFLLAQTTRQLINTVGTGLDKAGVAHAFTGPAGASLVAPFVTAVPVVELWVEAPEAPQRLCTAAGAEPVEDGHNLVFLQAKNDSPLLFRDQIEGRWVANRFRLYVDLLDAPQRGREQAEHLRAEQIGF